MRILFAVFALLVLTCATPAFSQDAEAGKAVRPYLAIKIGPSFMAADDIKNSSSGTDLAHVRKTEESGTVVAGGFAAGLQFKEVNRLEFEVMWRSGMEYNTSPTFTDAFVDSSIDSTLKSTSLMVNYFREFPVGGLLPYLTGGIGFAINKTETDLRAPDIGFDESDGKSETCFAWNIGLGAAYAVSENIFADLGWRYVNLGEAKWWSDRDDLQLTAEDLHTNEILFSVRYLF